MKTKNLKHYLRKAKKEGWAIGQFNFSTIDQLKGIVLAGQKLKSPLILGTSEGESRFIGLENAVNLVKFFRKESKLPLFLNLDHAKDLSYLKNAVLAGYDAVHFDGSELSFKDNVKKTKEAAKLARLKNVLIEGELGYLRGVSGLIAKKAKIKDSDLTDPEQAAGFVKKTKADCLAIAVGNVHGVCQKMPQVDQERIKEIAKATKAFLVFHGGSGFSEKEISQAIKNGIVKVNINSELRFAWKEALKPLPGKNQEVKPYKILEKAVLATKELVEEKIKAFGSQDKI